jgi:hypothetical protein
MPHLTDQPVIRMPGLHLGSPTTYGPLTIFPVWTDAPLTSRRPYTTATARGATVAELSDGPHVGRLQVTHDGHRPRVLFGGMLLEAGWQHRVLLDDVAVARGAHQLVDVACVEQNRWGGGRDQRPGRRVAPLAVRGATHGLRPTDQPRPDVQRERRADQDDVWRRVARYERMHGASVTSSLVEVAARLEDQVRALVALVQPLPGQRGVLIGVGGHPVLLEVFDHPRTLAEQWAGILGSVWMDAQAALPVPTSGHRARVFVQRVSSTPVQAADHAGAGRRLVVEDGSLVSGRGLALGETLVHAAVLNARHDLVLAA